jgi:cation diffusion facilitator CzcD-associated flavoprotein CzcO
MEHCPVILIGGGQAGLSVAYYLRRTETPCLILDAEPKPGGSWPHAWESLRLFSPNDTSSLPGWPMPPSKSDGYPRRDEVVEYLSRYEERYRFDIRRPVRVTAVRKTGTIFEIDTDRGQFTADILVSATGTWGNPVLPDYPGRSLFIGQQVHSARYRSPDAFAGKRVMVIGGGNSGAQILADLSEVAEVTWVTLTEPEILPDDVDGRVLFQRATDRVTGDAAPSPAAFGKIVSVPAVKAARDRGDLVSVRPFTRFTETGVIWPDGRETPVDAVIWCTGFKPALGHLAPLGVLEPEGRVKMQGYRAVKEPNLWLAGYGDWTGFASATLIGAGRTAREIGREITAALTDK